MRNVLHRHLAVEVNGYGKQAFQYPLARSSRPRTIRAIPGDSLTYLYIAVSFLFASYEAVKMPDALRRAVKISEQKRKNEESQMLLAGCFPRRYLAGSS